MKVTEYYVKLFHRIMGFKDGTMRIQKKHGQVVAVYLDDRELAPAEWMKYDLVPRGTPAVPRPE